ncbi:MAG TPA: hypothetical protein PLE92_09405, partial [Lentisphaeria bacterium]|nr:hypothetical protein [Lentisphaeria bacterium]
MASRIAAVPVAWLDRRSRSSFRFQSEIPGRARSAAGPGVGQRRFPKPDEQEELWLCFHCILAKACPRSDDSTRSNACFAQFEQPAGRREQTGSGAHDPKAALPRQTLALAVPGARGLKAALHRPAPVFPDARGPQAALLPRPNPGLAVPGARGLKAALHRPAPVFPG